MTLRRAAGAAAFAAMVLGAAGCASPEASRERGKGPGGDTGNRDADIELHGRVDPFHETPRRSPAPSPARAAEAKR